MARAASRSIGPPIAMGVTLCIILLILAVAWNVLVVQDALRLRGSEGVGTGHWLLLILGSLLFVLVLAGVILFIVFHARQIRDNQLQTNFIDAVTHEFRSPLTSLKLHLDTLRLRNVPPEKVGEFYALMTEDVERLSMLVEQVLEAGKAEHEGRKFDVEPLELGKQVAAVVTTVRRRHNLHNGELRTQIAPGLEVMADAAALEIVLHNLIENAVKYSREGQVDVLIAADLQRPGEVGITVRDSGVGIPKPQLKRVFQRFYRIGNELTRTRKGTGLGLFVAREILKGMKGRIEATSPGENLGSTFVVTLPGTRRA
ncbi:MAG: HAMP domain-containing histidine kinase [Candidatus Sericytochromatia bacterium]|uniref:histidine kinase n=1 Tax=Candidatus Tanganyikabacteria bacterium TaxID=2961651 RepID=A0A937X6I5_9BACT|nr:HAMP domain-containing histidine kinase [Candidatus Tanganyikabacteria bacterium]